MTIYSDDIKGYGETRWIELKFQPLPTSKGLAYVYSTRNSIDVELSTGTAGRLSVFNPSDNKTQVQVQKSVVTIWLDNLTADDVRDYQSDKMLHQFYDRETQKLISVEEMLELSDGDDVPANLVHYRA
jgi:hypothetical protein